MSDLRFPWALVFFLSFLKDMGRSHLRVWDLVFLKVLVLGQMFLKGLKVVSNRPKDLVLGNIKFPNFRKLSLACRMEVWVSTRACSMWCSMASPTRWRKDRPPFLLAGGRRLILRLLATSSL